MAIGKIGQGTNLYLNLNTKPLVVKGEDAVKPAATLLNNASELHNVLAGYGDATAEQYLANMGINVTYTKGKQVIDTGKLNNPDLIVEEILEEVFENPEQKFVSAGKKGGKFVKFIKDLIALLRGSFLPVSVNKFIDGVNSKWLHWGILEGDWKF